MANKPTLTSRNLPSLGSGDRATPLAQLPTNKNLSFGETVPLIHFGAFDSKESDQQQ